MMDYIPPPEFKTDECGLIECCVCGEKCVLYWLHDSVWADCQPDESCCGGHLCPTHAEEVLGRNLTLNDISVEKYLRTAKNRKNRKQVMMHCVVDIVIGAARHSGVELPSEWCSMWNEYCELGEKLSRQTKNAAQATRVLIEQTKLHFPNFSNPYDQFTI